MFSATEKIEERTGTLVMWVRLGAASHADPTGDRVPRQTAESATRRCHKMPSATPGGRIGSPGDAPDSGDHRGPGGWARVHRQGDDGDRTGPRRRRGPSP